MSCNFLENNASYDIEKAFFLQIFVVGKLCQLLPGSGTRTKPFPSRVGNGTATNHYGTTSLFVDLDPSFVPPGTSGSEWLIPFKRPLVRGRIGNNLCFLLVWIDNPCKRVAAILKVTPYIQLLLEYFSEQNVNADMGQSFHCYRSGSEFLRECWSGSCSSLKWYESTTSCLQNPQVSIVSV